MSRKPDTLSSAVALPSAAAVPTPSPELTDSTEARHVERIGKAILALNTGRRVRARFSQDWGDYRIECEVEIE